ncbi:hypothetical protein Dsin_030618 [Dipteronia sinensis]|uniref:Cysteine-rich receptor-like protein kinase 25 n=1 Tax=Dipteronia sinensis TaxID=43782 RepID=A0AAE0DRI3_9ROSI|nr:hypothetical protein Dsin_030618 [Dipteronia sinensis]
MSSSLWSIVVYSGLGTLLFLHLFSFLPFAMSQTPNSLSYICPSDQNHTASGYYMYNVGQLFNQKLYDKGNKSIYYGEYPDKVYGVYLCRFDVTQETCQNCIVTATNWLVQECNSNKTAIAWFDECMVRYSNISSFSTLETHPSVYWMNCIPDLSTENCRACLNKAAYSLLEFFKGKRGGRVLNPSCNIRYELYPFYGDPATTDGAPAPNNGEERANSQEIQLIRLGEGRMRNDYSYDDLQREKQMESQEFPLFPLSLALEATQHFSNENKLGEGGFGPVYKGILADGKEIAVKRLSKSSGQGLLEFKNEVTLIAKLQHKNLVSQTLGLLLRGKGIAAHL